VTIGFSASDPALALTVARDLGELVAETQTAREVQAATAQVDSLRVAVDNAASESARQRDRLEQAERTSSERSDVGKLLRAQQFARALESAEKASRSIAAELFEAQTHLRAIQQIGGRVQIVDPGIPPWRVRSRRSRFVSYAAVALAMSVPLAVILIGALDPMIRDEQDVRRTGMLWLGCVPDRSKLPREVVV
jgi:hypothetical protein